MTASTDDTVSGRAGARRRGSAGGTGATDAAVTATTRDGVSISCYLERKADAAPGDAGSGGRRGKKRPLAVVCHGLMNTHQSSTVRRMCSRLPFSCVTFDFRGMGHSGGATAVGNYLSEAEDLDAVVAEARRRWGGEFELAAVVGHSKAGSVVLFWAATVMRRWMDRPPGEEEGPGADRESDWWHGGCLRIVNLSGRFDLSQGAFNRYTDEQKRLLLGEPAAAAAAGGAGGGEEAAVVLAEYGGGKDSNLAASNPDSDADPRGAFPVRRYLVRPSDVRQRLETRMEPVGETARNFFREGRVPPFRVKFLTVHGGKDEVIPVRDAQLYHDLLKPRHELFIVPEGDHRFTRAADMDAAAARICSWVGAESTT